eukprot:GHRR01010932.1.p1 GENE.GHRR01010932.1~~GHRR01010932.1.p1  ORF type:complete len:186 (+),score=53.16 GHRR01010932.1:111-668(+)
MAGLVQLGHENSVNLGERIAKESYDRCVVLIKEADNMFNCYELPDTSFAQCDAAKMQTVPGSRRHPVYRDSDGMLWVNLPHQVKPVIDKSLKPYTENWGLGSAITGENCPPPLVPFAGCDRKALPPSPAKPFELPASPLKPSPFKERVDVATDAVVRKNWSARQAKMGDFFGPKKKPVTADCMDM